MNPTHTPKGRAVMPKPENETREAERQKLEERRMRDTNKFFDWLEGKR